MKLSGSYLWFLLGVILVAVAPAAQAAGEIDPVLAAGLRACEANDLRAGVRTWYADDLNLAVKLQSQLEAATKNLGDIVGTEIVSSRTFGQKVRRYYGRVFCQETAVDPARSL